MTAEESKMEKILEFFKYTYNFEILEEFIAKDNKKDKLSLRLIDWFVTNYAKHYGVVYDIKKANGSIQEIWVWLEYHSELSSEGKAHFDPFRRGKKQGKIIELEYETGKTLETTLAQLNFFRWAIKNGVIDYVRKFVDEIYDDMCQRGSISKNKNNLGKKHQLSINVSKTLGCHKINGKWARKALLDVQIGN